MKQIAETDSCQAPRMGYYVSGRIKVVMDAGQETEFGPGDLRSSRLDATVGPSAMSRVSSSTGRASRIRPSADACLTSRQPLRTRLRIRPQLR